MPKQLSDLKPMTNDVQLMMADERQHRLWKACRLLRDHQMVTPAID